MKYLRRVNWKQGEENKIRTQNERPSDSISIYVGLKRLCTIIERFGWCNEREKTLLTY